MHQLTNSPIYQLNLVTQLVATRRAVLVWKKGIDVGVGFIRPETGLMNQTPTTNYLFRADTRSAPTCTLQPYFSFSFSSSFFPNSTLKAVR